MIESSIMPQKVTRSDALSAYVDYEFYTLRQHQDDLQRIMHRDQIRSAIDSTMPSQYRGYENW